MAQRAYDSAHQTFMLTPDAGWQSGSVMLDHRIDLSYDFQTSFDVYLGNNDKGADGLAFVLQNDPLGENARGGIGGSYGAVGIKNGLGIAFDTYQNAFFGDMADDHTNFIDTDVPMAISRISDQHSIGNSGNVEDGQWHNVLVNWNATDQTLSYWFDGKLAGSLNQNIIAKYLDGSPYAYLGFAAATGGGHNLQQVHLNSLTAWLEGQPHSIIITETSDDLNAASDAQIANIDAISAAGANAGVTIDLQHQSDGFTIIGSAFADTLTGSSGADTIIGGSGGDTLAGGAGSDVFKYAAVSDSSGAGNSDTVLDFMSGEDRIDLSAISGLTSFKVSGLTSASDAIQANTIAWFHDEANNQTIVYGNNTASEANGGSAGLLELHLAGVSSVALNDLSIPAQTSNSVGVAGEPIYLGLPLAATNGTGLTVDVAGLPSGWTLNGGIQQPNGTWTATDDLGGLTVTSPEGFAGAVDLAITASWTDSEGSAFATTIKDNLKVYSPSIQDPTALSDGASLNGSAAYDSAHQTFVLTPDAGWQSGSVMLDHRIDLSYDFQTSFDVYLGNNDKGADGLAFVLQNDPLGENALGGLGGSYGAVGIKNGLGIAFDTYQNAFFGDMADDHTNFFDTDVPMAISRIGDQHSIGNSGNVEDGQWHNVLVNWNATDQTFSYWFDGKLAGSLNEDIATDYLGGSPYAYFGFAAATGGGHNLQQVHLNSLTALLEGQSSSVDAGVVIDLRHQSDGFTITGSPVAITITGSSGPT